MPTPSSIDRRRFLGTASAMTAIAAAPAWQPQAHSQDASESVAEVPDSAT